jgi:hypothetical protein
MLSWRKKKIVPTAAAEMATRPSTLSAEFPQITALRVSDCASFVDFFMG